MNCSTTPVSFNVQYFYDSQCTTCDECGASAGDAKCISYTGANLPCSLIETYDSVETALQKIDEKICSISGDFSSYQMNCLPTWWGNSITTEEEFVAAITSYACEITESLQTFTGVTFPGYQSSVSARFETIEGPGITCTVAGVTSSDSLEEVLTKYCSAFSTFNDTLSLTGVDWDQCFTVTTPPTTLAEAFSLVIDQICQVEAVTGSLPTFNNASNCLAGTTTDTLVETIDLITTRLCQTNTFDVDSLDFGCIPSGADLQEVTQNVLNEVNSLVQARVTYSEDFVVTQTDEDDVCAGITVALAIPLNQDRFVAVNDGDTSPGTLVDKIVAGTGITLTVVGETLEIESAGTTDTFEVKANEDGVEGFLDEKISGGTSEGLTITAAYDSGDDQLKITPSIDGIQFFTYLLNQLDTDSELYELFCTKVANCPSPCAAPSDVQIVAITNTTTTTLIP